MTLSEKIHAAALAYAKDEYGSMSRHGTHYERDHDVAVSRCAFEAGARAGYRLAIEELRSHELYKARNAYNLETIRGKGLISDPIQWAADWLKERMKEGGVG